MIIPKVDPKVKPKAMNCDCAFCSEYKGSVKKPAKWDSNKHGDHTAVVFINRCSTKSTWILDPFYSGQDFVKACVALERNYVAFNTNRSPQDKKLGVNKVVTTADPATFMQDHMLMQGKSISLAYLDFSNPKANNESVSGMAVQSFEMMMDNGFMVARLLKTNKQHTAQAATIDSLSDLKYKGCVISYNAAKALLLNLIWKKEK